VILKHSKTGTSTNQHFLRYYDPSVEGFNTVYYDENVSAETHPGYIASVNRTEWMMVVVIHDYVNNNKEFHRYQPGKTTYHNTNTASISPVNTTNSDVHIFSEPGNTSYGGYGQFGELRVYDTTFTIAELDAKYAAQKGKYGIASPFIEYVVSDSSSYSGSGTTITDLRGNNDGDILGGIESTYDNTSFDITGSGDGITTSSTVSINPNTDGMSIEIWFKLDADNFNYLFSFDGSGTTNFGLSYRANVDQVWWFYQIGAAAYDTMQTSTISLNTWYHVVATTDGSTGELYLNGQLVDSSTSAPHSVNYNEDLHFGNMYDLAQNDNTKIGAASFYKKGLTASDVLEKYNATKSTYGL